MQNEKGRLYDKFRNRLIFPVIDVRGDVVAFGGRVLDKTRTVNSLFLRSSMAFSVAA